MYLKIGGAALNQTPIAWQQNTQNILEAIAEAQRQGIQILCLPELCITGYGCEDIFLSDWVVEESIEQLLSIIPYTDNIAVCVGLPLRLEGLQYNCSCFIHDKKILGFSAKQFLANDGIHYEPRWFSPWSHSKISQVKIKETFYPIGDIVYNLHDIKIGFEICEDAWVSDAIRPASRLLAQEVDMIMNPSASHFSFGKSEVRYGLIIGSSERFQCTYLYSNLLGNEAGRAIYDGEVLIAHHGKLIQRNHRFSFHNINLVSAEINFKTKENIHSILTPDVREKEYEFWEATSLGLFDYMRKSKSKGFVLSLSGGADSSACAIMVAEMVKKGLKELGWKLFIQKANIVDRFDLQKLGEFSTENMANILMGQLLLCAYQGTENSSSDTFESAQHLAQSIGATFYHWQIDDQVSANIAAIEQNIGRSLSWQHDDIALQNIQARTRSPLIWLLTNISNALLITTSNRSEGSVGYTTMDGDTSGSIAPIAGVDKDFIRKWLVWVEKNHHQTGLRKVNALAPTAELRPLVSTQTDEKDLMPYHILSAIEREAIRNRKSPMQVYLLLKILKFESEEDLKKHIIKFFQLWCRNQWKRERLAPSFHLDDFSVDSRTWCRFPILSGGFEKELSSLKEVK